MYAAVMLGDNFWFRVIIQIDELKVKIVANNRIFGLLVNPIQYLGLGRRLGGKGRGGSEDETGGGKSYCQVEQQAGITQR